MRTPATRNSHRRQLDPTSFTRLGESPRDEANFRCLTKLERAQVDKVGRRSEPRFVSFGRVVSAVDVGAEREEREVGDFTRGEKLRERSVEFGSSDLERLERRESQECFGEGDGNLFEEVTELVANSQREVGERRRQGNGERVNGIRRFTRSTGISHPRDYDGDVEAAKRCC